MGTVPAFNHTTFVGTVVAGMTLATVSVPSGAYACSYVSYYTGVGISTNESENIALQSDPLVASSFVTADLMLNQPTANAAMVMNHFLVYATSVIKLIAVGNASATTVIYHVMLNAVLPGPSGSFL